ncbi:4652_t:CDS:2 [Ambispora gerdemannii]|uniref:4652_t:CDS:1 n=1 Tax=Ambispora gerdemannii TaxID=144530 RepID=A0A9N9FCH2_9GLOM|nr:4652_t:CDS:2 [Ambispora gerdemannii]
MPPTNANDSENFVTFNLTAPSTVGWFGVGIGDGMIGSYLMIAWPNSDNTITISQRKAVAHAEPPTTDQQTDLNLDSSLSGVRNGQMIAIIKRAVTVSGSTMTTSGEQSFVWAFSKTNPKSNQKNARLTQHDNKGTTSFNLVTSSSGSPATDVQTINALNSEDGLTRNQKLAIAHGSLMCGAWLITMPIGIFMARFARKLLPNAWFNLHWSIQVFGTTTLAILAYILIQLQDKVWESKYVKTHRVLGNIIFFGLLGQMVLGMIHHRLYRPDRESTPWWTKLHWWVGRTLFVLALVQIVLGFETYNVVTSVYVVYFTYVCFLIIALLYGYARVYLGWSTAEYHKPK